MIEIWLGRVEKMQKLTENVRSLRDNLGLSNADARRNALNNISMICSSISIIINMFANYEKGNINSKVLEACWGVREKDQHKASEFIEKTNRLSLVLLFQFQIENLFKNLLRELVPSYRTLGYHDICKKILEVTNISDEENKFNILYTPALIRNSLHSNGIHHGYKGSDSIIQIGELKYEFLNGKKVSCASWEHVIVALSALTDLVREILYTQKIRMLKDPIADEYYLQKKFEQN